MAVYYFQGSPILAPFTIRSNEPVFSSDTISLKHQRLSQDAQRWELNFNVITNDKTVSLLLDSIVDANEAKTMIMPQLKEVVDVDTVTVTGNILVATNANAGATSISMKRNTAEGFLPRGSFVSFSNHSKVYIVTNVNGFDFDPETNDTLQIYPALVNNVIASSTVLNIHDNVLLSYYRDISDIRGITFSDGILSSPGTINIFEAV